MTGATAPPGTAPGSRRPALPRALLRPWRLLTTVLGPLWVTVVRDPVREGRLRLEALSRLERQLTRAGLVMLAILLGSLLLSARWRTEQLLPLAGANDLKLLPIGVLGLTLLALTLGWSLVVWGALDAAPSVRLVVAALFLVTMPGLVASGKVVGGDTWLAEHGSTVVHAGFLVTPALLVVSALVSLASSRLHRGRRLVEGLTTAVLRSVAVAALAAYFLGVLAVFVDSSDGGVTSPAPFALDSAVNALFALSVPLVYVSAVVVVDLAYDVSDSLRGPARRLSPRWAFGLLVALVAVKLARELGGQLSVWVDLVTNQPASVARTVGSVALLAGLVWWVRRLPENERFVDAKEKVIYVGTLLLAAPLLFFSLLSGLATLWFTEFESRAVASWSQSVPYDGISRWYPLAMAGLAVAGGLSLMRRSRGGYGDELGSAMVVVGSWNVPASLVSGFQVGVPFSLPLVDVLVTVGALVVAATVVVRRRTLPPSETSLLLAVVVLFTWLVMGRGDYISLLGGALGFSAVVVVAFGVLYSLLSDSAFASDSSKRLPTAARPMLYVGYTLISVVLLHWTELTHEADDYGTTTAFVRIAIPLAAWLVGRRLLVAGPSEEPQAAAVLR